MDIDVEELQRYIHHHTPILCEKTVASCRAGSILVPSGLDGRRCYHDWLSPPQGECHFGGESNLLLLDPFTMSGCFWTA